MRSGSTTVILLALMVFLILPASAALTVVTSGPQTIARADTVTLTGTGAQNGSVILWVIGRNYFETKTATPDKKGNFTFLIKPQETTLFSSGKYAFLIQDPGADKSFEIAPLIWSDGIRIANQGKVITNIGQKTSFPADISPVASTILNVSERPDVDDIFTPYYFYVEDPYIRFNRVGESGGQLPDQTTGSAPDHGYNECRSGEPAPGRDQKCKFQRSDHVRYHSGGEWHQYKSVDLFAR